MLRGDGSQSVGKHGYCLYVADSLSFIHVDVGLMNVEKIFLPDQMFMFWQFIGLPLILTFRMRTCFFFKRV